MMALAVGYTAQSRLSDHGTFMKRGLNDTAQLPFSIGAAIGSLMNLCEEQIASGIAIAGSSGGAHDVIRFPSGSRRRTIDDCLSTQR